ncbi:MAG: ABC transporter permease subunit [Actinobacteria bacterium]|nr:ABC transporter permease subunit [Actinomycetota bacterium]MBI3688593.1 ABC transporter permease subunit [Actinomycetota bacterium]
MRTRLTRIGVLLFAGAYFALPIVSSFLFSIKDNQANVWTAKYYTGIVGAEGFWPSLRTSLMMAVLVIGISLALMLPTMLVVHLRHPKVRQLVELVTLLPLVIPPIVLVVGVRTVLGWGPDYFAGTPTAAFLSGIQDTNLPWVLVLTYVVLAMPFTYRSLDAGLRAIDLHTQVEAARNLGAGWGTVLTRIAAPGLRGALLNASFLAFALVIGEYTIASILLFTPFPVWLVALGLDHAQLSVSVSVLSLFLTWLALLSISVIGSRGGRSATLRSV